MILNVLPDNVEVALDQKLNNGAFSLFVSILIKIKNKSSIGKTEENPTIFLAYFLGKYLYFLESPEAGDHFEPNTSSNQKNFLCILGLEST